jgi:hypothetical protein
MGCVCGKPGPTAGLFPFGGSFQGAAVPVSQSEDPTSLDGEAGTCPVTAAGREMFRILRRRRHTAACRAESGTNPSGRRCKRTEPAQGSGQRESIMKRVILRSFMAVALVAGSAAVAQVSVTIGQPEETRIKEYVVKEKVKPTMLKERVTVGATLPADVELAPVPSEWGPSVSKYRYVYTNDNVVLVEPSSRRVIHIIE